MRLIDTAKLADALDRMRAQGDENGLRLCALRLTAQATAARTEPGHCCLCKLPMGDGSDHTYGYCDDCSDAAPEIKPAEVYSRFMRYAITAARATLLSRWDERDRALSIMGEIERDWDCRVDGMRLTRVRVPDYARGRAALISQHKEWGVS